MNRAITQEDVPHVVAIVRHEVRRIGIVEHEAPILIRIRPRAGSLPASSEVVDADALAWLGDRASGPDDCEAKHRDDCAGGASPVAAAGCGTSLNPFAHSVS